MKLYKILIGIKHGTEIYQERKVAVESFERAYRIAKDFVEEYAEDSSEDFDVYSIHYEGNIETPA